MARTVAADTDNDVAVLVWGVGAGVLIVTFVIVVVFVVFVIFVIIVCRLLFRP